MSSPLSPINCKVDDPNSNLTASISASSPRKCAIGKPSLRLSIPTVQQVFDAKAQSKQSDINNSISNASASASESASANVNANVIPNSNDSFVKRMVENCNNQSQCKSVPDKAKSNIEQKINRNDIKIIVDRIKNGVKSPIDLENKSYLSISPGIPEDSDKHSDVSDENDSNPDVQNNNMSSHILRLPSYSNFENDFRKKFDEMSTSSRLDLHMKGLSTFVCSVSFFFFSNFKTNERN